MKMLMLKVFSAPIQQHLCGYVSILIGFPSTAVTKPLEQSAFSTCLAAYGFDFYHMLVLDLMHEFELGVWKATFTHLICILVAAGGNTVQELDAQ